MSTALVKREPAPILRRETAPPLKLGLFDRFALAVFPGWGMRRLQARVAAEFALRRASGLLARHYDAAGSGPRTYGWRKHTTDADAAAAPYRASLRDLARDIRRNNSWAKRGIEVIANNTVGHGINPKIQASPRVKKRAKEAWDDWSGSVDCDFNGRISFAGIQLLAMKTVVEAGEVLIVRKTPPRSRGMEIGLQLQVLEPDHLDSSRDVQRLEGGGKIVEGIEYDAEGRRAFYHLFPEHPGGRALSLFTRGLQSVRVPADRVIHVYMVDRPGQGRGVSWLASVAARLQDFDDFEDAELVQQKIAACFAAFVKNDLDGAMPAIGSQDAEAQAASPELETIQPGMVEYLGPGQTIDFATPPQPQSDQGFSQRSLRRIAAGLGVTYEDLTGDYSQVNFSSARMARLGHYKSVWTWQNHMLIPQLCAGVWRWFAELAVLGGILRSVPRVTWATPPIPMLEPEKEGPALRDMVRGGFKTFGEALAERGLDPDTQLDEIDEWNRKLDERGIVIDSDPRRVTKNGQLQVAASSGDSEPEVDDASGDESDEE